MGITAQTATGGAPAAGMNSRQRPAIHPAWEAFMHYCAQLGHGEIEKLRVQDGLPMVAELTTKRVKFP